MKKILPIITILTIIVLLFASCMGAESKIKIQNDGSGTISFTYRISQMLLNMGEEAGGEGTDEESGEEGNADVPLPLTQEDFEKSVEGIEGLRLIEVKQTETETDLIITAKLEFDDVESLSQSEAFSEWPVTFEKAGNSYVYRQILSEGQGEEGDAAMDEETINMIESMFTGYEFSFSVETPSPIKEYNIGELSADKKTVTYTIPIADMMRIKEKLVFVVTW
jgi:hypothetical protein